MAEPKRNPWSYVWRFPLLLLLGVASTGFARALIEVGLQLWPAFTLWRTFVLGGLLFAVFWQLWLAKRAAFWSTLLHELTHALFALLFLKRIYGLRVFSRSGGYLRVEEGNLLIALAPYFFPLVPLTLLGLKFLIRPDFHPLWNALLGASLVAHLLILQRDFHFRQPDLRYAGLVTSVVVVFFFNLFFAGLILAALPPTTGLVKLYLANGVLYSRQNLFWSAKQAYQLFQSISAAEF